MISLQFYWILRFFERCIRTSRLRIPWDCSWSFYWFMWVFSWFYTCWWRVVDGTRPGCLRILMSFNWLNRSLFWENLWSFLTFWGFPEVHWLFWMTVSDWSKRKDLFNLFWGFHREDKFRGVIFYVWDLWSKTKIAIFYRLEVCRWIHWYSTRANTTFWQNLILSFRSSQLALRRHPERSR